MQKTINKWFRLSIAIGLVLTLAPGCSKTDDSTDAIVDATTSTSSGSTSGTTTTTETNTLTATVNNTTSLSFYPIVTNLTTYFYISGQGISNGLKLNVPTTVSVGTYAVNGSTWDIEYFPNLANSSSPITLTSGSITIATYDSTTKKATGTFTAVGTQSNVTYNITNGAFTVYLK